MAIADRTRKMLWARSGNRCAICRTELTFDSSESVEHAVVGEECHIRARRAGGPRFDPKLLAAEIDEYGNLILLCATHHKQVDDQVSQFDVDRLIALKKAHEVWVRSRLDPGPNKFSAQLDDLEVIADGWTLLNMMIGTHASEYSYSQPKTREETEALARFADTVHEWGEIGMDLTPGQRLERVATQEQADGHHRQPPSSRHWSFAG